TAPPMFAAGRRVSPAAAIPKEAECRAGDERPRGGGGRMVGWRPRMQETPGIRTSPGCRGFPPLARDAPLGFGLASVDAAGLTPPSLSLAARSAARVPLARGLAPAAASDLAAGSPGTEPSR